MNLIIKWSRNFFLVLVITQLSGSTGVAQKRFIQPLQQHKLLYADTVYRRAIATNDSLLLAESYYLYGKTYDAAGDNLTAQRWFWKSLRILEPRGDSFELSRLYNRLSGTQESYSETRRYAVMSLAVAQRIRSDNALLRAYGNLANIYREDWSMGGRKPGLPKPLPDSALHYLRKIYYIAHKQNDSVAIIESHIGLGNFLWSTYHTRRGIDFLESALAIATKAKEDGQRIKIIMKMASIYTSLREPDRVGALLSQARRLLDQSPIKDYYINAEFENLYLNYYQLIGDWKEAFEHSQKLYGIEQSKYSSDRNGAISRLNVEYKTEQKEAQLRAQQKELALRNENLIIQQRFIWIVSALLLITAIMSVVFFGLYRKNQRISAHNAELVKEQNHRVKNNLQVVSSLLNLQASRLTDVMAKKAVEESQLRVEAMAILHRRLYDGDQLAMVNLAEYIPELVDSVLLAFGYGSIQPMYELEPIDLPANQALSLGLLLNELTTNACKYAFPTHPKPAFRVACHQVKNQISFLVADNGPGFLPQLSADLLGRFRVPFGMRLIQMQAEQLRGIYQFVVRGGTIFTLEFNR